MAIREGQPEVGDGKVSDGALHLHGYSGHVVIGALYRSGRALVKVGLKPRSEPKDVEEPSDRGEVVGVRVAEDDDVIRIKRDAGTGMLGHEPLEEPEINRTKKHGVEDVDDDRE